MKTRRLLVCLIVALLAAAASHAAPLEPLWMTGAGGGNAQSEFNCVTADGRGNVYAAGCVFGADSTGLGNGVSVRSPSAPRPSAVVVKYDSHGRIQWARTLVAATDESNFLSVAVDDSGNVYVAGSIAGGTFDFGSGVRVKGEAWTNPVLVKYDYTGAAVWARTIADRYGSYSEDSAPCTSTFFAVAVDAGGYVYAAGDATQSGWSVGFAVRAPGYTSVPEEMIGDGQAMLVKFDPDGRAMWARATDGDRVSSRYNAIAIDSARRICVAGEISGYGTCSFGSGVLVSPPTRGHCPVLAKYSPNGTPLWARSVSGPGSLGEYSALTVDGTDAVYALGEVYGSDKASFGNGVSAQGAASEKSTVLAKYDAAGRARWARTRAQDAAAAEARTVAADDTSVYFVGAAAENGALLEGFDLAGKRPTATLPVLYGDERPRVRALRADGNGNLLVAGQTADFQAFVAKVPVSDSARATAQACTDQLLHLNLRTQGPGNVTPRWTQVVGSGWNIKITATPEDSYRFAYWTVVSGEGVRIEHESRPSTFVTLQSTNAIVEATFVRQVNQAPQSVTSSADGKRFAVCAWNKPIFTSDDGTSWMERELIREWTSITFSADGRLLAACAFGDPILTSADAGVTWTRQGASGARQWNAIASSADGIRLAACAWHGYVYTSSDAGVTWTEHPETGRQLWQAIACSSDGRRLAACASPVGNIFTSTDYGVTWTKQEAAGSRDWSSIASSSDGTRIVAGATFRGLFGSTDGGLTWTNLPGPPAVCDSVAMSADGSRIAACTSGLSMFLSADGGVTWRELSYADHAHWISVAASADGQSLVAIDYKASEVETSADGGVTWRLSKLRYK